MGDLDGALHSYEQVMRHNSWSVPAMVAIAGILRAKDRFAPAIEYLNQILKIEPNNGEVWGMLGEWSLDALRPNRPQQPTVANMGFVT